ncbi:MAG: dihydroneopterin aldolase [Hyphomicrobiaceae bacterium]
MTRHDSTAVIDRDAEHLLSNSSTSKATANRTRLVRVRDLEVIASIGVYEREHRYLQRALVSIELEVADTYDGTSDTLSQVYDYDEAIEAAESIFAHGHINLIETAAERIAERCLRNPSVASVRVSIDKPDVVANCRSVGIEILRTRSHR